MNLAWAVERVRAAVAGLAPERRAAAARATADAMAEEDVETNRAIGIHGAAWILGRRPGPHTAAKPLAILTHCNAGWLATVDGGTALAPIYRLHDEGVAVHVWVDETRPRNQGARLTAWELLEHGVPCTLVADNAGGHLCQRGLVDLCIVGADRVTSTGDVANKIGTYLKALAAAAHDVPFLVAVPSSTIDPELLDGVASIPIERRDPSGGHPRRGGARGRRQRHRAHRARGRARGEPRVRRHPGPPRVGPRHRARRRRRDRRGDPRRVPGAVRGRRLSGTSTGDDLA